jgi:DNA topoisomerase-6 subunit B
MRGRGSVDEYLEQTAIANPHVTIHYLDPEGTPTTYEVHDAAAAGAAGDQAASVWHRTRPAGDDAEGLNRRLDVAVPDRLFLARQLRRGAEDLRTAKISTAANPKRIGRHEAEALFQAIQNTKNQRPAPTASLRSGRR